MVVKLQHFGSERVNPLVLPRDNPKLVSYMSAYTPSTRRRLVYKNNIPLLRRRYIPLFRGRN